MGCGTTHVWAGETSWFCCGGGWGPCGSTGHGACGTCNSGSHQGAWPNLSQACWDVTNPGACGEYMPRLGCGSVLNIQRQCTGGTVCISLADCGPDTQLWCNEETCCNGECRTHRVLDLTPSAFSAIGSLSSGLLPVFIYE
jgi:hypothetical protein